MKTISTLVSLAAISAAFFVGVRAAPQVGQAAPDFSLTDINGNTHSLSDYRGRIVVVEWTNPECPFVRKHYEKSGNIPALQRSATADGVVWLTINSGHAGAQGDFDKIEADAWMKSTGAAATAYFRDRDGKVGRSYDARTTPHIFIVDPAGTLVYAGGIDDIRSADAGDIPKAKNYVQAALADLKAGRPVATPTSRPYGCGVHYGR